MGWSIKSKKLVPPAPGIWALARHPKIAPKFVSQISTIYDEVDDV
jgi:hypothetical protein